MTYFQIRSTMNSKPPETRSLKIHEDPEDSAYHRLPPPSLEGIMEKYLLWWLDPPIHRKYRCASQSFPFQAEERYSEWCKASISARCMEAFASYPVAPRLPIKPCQEEERLKYKILIDRYSWLSHTSSNNFNFLMKTHRYECLLSLTTWYWK